MHQESIKESTVVLMPPNLKQVKRSVNAYGYYNVPTNTLQVREHQEEEPLSIYRPIGSPAIQDFMPIQVQSMNSSTRRPKVTMPICHSTEALCVSTTQGCSGHGQCYKKNRDASSGDTAKDCWACGCTASVVKIGDGGSKTTNWGGLACQKKDVSAPFFLLAGFTIFAVATLSWGIGLIYSIGEEDLPSVIGAGVTGPRAQK